MKRARLWISCIALCLPAFAAPSSAQDVTIGRWKGSMKMEGGVFSHCSVAANNRFATIFLLAPSSFELFVGHPEVKFPLGEKWSQPYQIDNGPIVRGRARVVMESMFAISLTASDIERVRVGRTMKLVTDGPGTTFSLDGVGPAIAWLEKCVADNIARRPTRRN